MSRFPIDLSKFKKSHEDKHTVTLRHHEGHEFRIAKNAVNAKMRGMLAQLPQASMPHLSDGGEPTAADQIAQSFGFPNAGPKPVKKADGGEIKLKDLNKDKKVKSKDEKTVVAEMESDEPNAPMGRMYADGGEAKPSPSPRDDVPEPNKKNAAEAQKGATESKPKDFSYLKNLKEGLGMSQGGMSQSDQADRQFEADLKEKGSQIGYEQDEDPYRDMGYEERKARKASDEAELDRRRKYAEGGEAEQPQQSSSPQGPVVINVGGGQAPAQQGPQQQQMPPESMAHHIGKAIREGLSTAIQDTVGAAKYAAAPIGQFAQGVAGVDPNEAAADQQLMPKAQEPSKPLPDQGAQPQKAPQDLYGTEAYSKAYEQGIEKQKAGIQQEAEAQSVLGQQQEQILGSQAAAQQRIVNDYSKHLGDLQSERKNFIDDIQNQHIDPNHYFGSMDTGQKMATIAGLILGGFGGPNNGAQQFVNNQIDRDIQAQKANLGKSENLLNANLRQFGNLRDATDMTRVMMMDTAASQLKAAVAGSADPQAQARAQQALGALETQAAPILSQIAMRRSLISGMQSGQVDPSQVIRMVVPPEQQNVAYKELKEAQELTKTKEDVKLAIKKIYDLNRLSSRVGSPIQSRKQIAAIRDPLLAHVSTVLANRFTEQDAQMIGSLLDQGISGNDESLGVAMQQADSLFGQKMNFPILEGIGIHMNSLPADKRTPIQEYPNK